ncbi:hypothetical protein [Rufibacter quisquiliarum]|uniref:Uncharacterized protein n=1 Tax=Rufibacter quisquiliarum TaxID=1549639 RepID=A0A839GUT4_9BACT|nr:hypothetical protein [Rufibacter quisquiliarum]MBA9078188.1 hypothetical protein [Rufibacter quisquiliarum]
MSIIKAASNVREVEAVLDVFTRMRALTDELPVGTGKTGAKRGLKPKAQQ